MYIAMSIMWKDEKKIYPKSNIWEVLWRVGGILIGRKELGDNERMTNKLSHVLQIEKFIVKSGIFENT